MAVPDSSWYENQLRGESERLSAALERERLLTLQNQEYRKALEAIANDKEGPFYPDGDAMGEAMCAKIALGRNCGLCGSTLPCREHVAQKPKRVDPPQSRDWKCAKCGKVSQFKDGMCWDCFGGDPGQ
jgi:hypothetical protein